METDETQILRTIRGTPYDDIPRLVYADWLEENGRPERAEFIRLQCALESDPDDEPRRPALLSASGRFGASSAVNGEPNCRLTCGVSASDGDLSNRATWN